MSKLQLTQPPEDKQRDQNDRNDKSVKYKTRDRQSISMQTPGNRRQTRSSTKAHISFRRPHTHSYSESRVVELSNCKAVPIGFFEDRRSVYWDNNIPVKDYTQTTTPQLTKRGKELALPKELHANYLGDRPSPIWTVTIPPKNHTSSERTESLAQSKLVHNDYRPCRTVETVITSTALRAVSSARVRDLSHPKSGSGVPQHTLEEWGQPAWEISGAAKNAIPSGQLDQLANPKNPHKNYFPPREVIWTVSKSAKRAIATEQVLKLSNPKSYNAGSEDYNPNAWVVSEGAKRAAASAHTITLATPIARKQRQKLIKAT